MEFDFDFLVSPLSTAFPSVSPALSHTWHAPPQRPPLHARHQDNQTQLGVLQTPGQTRGLPSMCFERTSKNHSIKSCIDANNLEATSTTHTPPHLWYRLGLPIKRPWISAYSARCLCEPGALCPTITTTTKHVKPRGSPQTAFTQNL